jgi:hypothetical protein
VAYDLPEDDGPADPDAIALAAELLDRCRPLAEGSPAWRYLTEQRGLPAPASTYCKADLRQLEPEIPCFDRLAYGVVSLLRDKDGDIAGLSIEACGPAGERMLDRNGRTARKSFRLRDRGCAESLFRVRAASEGAMIAYMTEGRLAKVIAVAAVLEDAAIYGAGGRPSLGMVAPPEPTVVLIADRKPSDPEEAELHKRDLRPKQLRDTAGGQAAPVVGLRPRPFAHVEPHEQAGVCALFFRGGVFHLFICYSATCQGIRGSQQFRICYPE